MYRIAGLYAPANGEFSTPVLTVPTTPMWVNADVRWHGKLRTWYEGVQGCDEGCAAYLYAAVLDAETGRELPGYGVNATDPLVAVDGLQLQLRCRLHHHP